MTRLEQLGEQLAMVPDSTAGEHALATLVLGTAALARQTSPRRAAVAARSGFTLAMAALDGVGAVLAMFSALSVQISHWQRGSSLPAAQIHSPDLLGLDRQSPP
jgi:hypothetical protein